MPRGDKSAYTTKQKRQAAHIEDSYEDRGVAKDEAERRAWATVNKQTGGGKKRSPGRKTAKSASRSASAQSSASRKSASSTARKHATDRKK